MKQFESIYSHGFVRVAVAVPEVTVSNPDRNVERMVPLIRAAAAEKAALVLFPELGISAYSNEDLFQQQALLESTEANLRRLLEATLSVPVIVVCGAPLAFSGLLFNCGIVSYKGKLLGVVPKTFLPNYREFYEKRQFSSALQAPFSEVTLLGNRIPFGNDLIFRAGNLPAFGLFVEICEDLWAPIPPSTRGALSGATVIANLSASNITIGKAEYRRNLAAAHSGKCLSAYLYSAAGGGESTTDLAWDGHGMIWENGSLLAESERFSRKESLITADIDMDRLFQERLRISSFRDTVPEALKGPGGLREVIFDLDLPAGPVPLKRVVERFPFVPADTGTRSLRCREAYNIQVQGLAKRLTSSGIRKLVLGVSGGLDSTQALVVAAKTMDLLGLPRSGILAYTLPGFATSSRTRSNALDLMRALGVTGGEIDIRPACELMLKMLGHPYGSGKPVFDVTFENVQAGERTSFLFRAANMHGALVLGTGDLSELALGWCTYGVGDHMSHYNVNASVPKTLVQHLIRWVAESGEFGEEASMTMRSILATEISPELVPPDAGATDAGVTDAGATGVKPENAGPAQSTQKVIGPYELQDFNLYYISRFGFRPSKVAYLCHQAWKDATHGPWPFSNGDGGPPPRNSYTLPEIKKWLRIFLKRFFGTSQFKRSCVPNGPKVGSGGSLSPRGDWRAPSDSDPEIWLRELEENVPDEIGQ